MKAGPKLNALVAEHIFGWTIVRVSKSQFGIRELDGADYNYRDSIYDQYSQDDGSDYFPPIYLIPPYSTDIRAAWDVIGKVSQWHWDEQNSFGIVLRDDLKLEVGTYDYSSLEFVCDLCLITPLSICLAALQAKGVKVRS